MYTESSLLGSPAALTPVAKGSEASFTMLRSALVPCAETGCSLLPAVGSPVGRVRDDGNDAIIETGRGGLTEFARLGIAEAGVIDGTLGCLACVAFVLIL